MAQKKEFERWTAKKKSEMVLSLVKGETNDIRVGSLFKSDSIG